MIKDITPRQFLDRRAAGEDMTLLDVREDWETALAPVPSALVHIPMGQIAARLGELDLEAPRVGDLGLHHDLGAKGRRTIN